jgi:hypothetical protein
MPRESVMSKKIIWLLIVFLLFISCKRDPENENETLLQKLRKLPDVIVTEITAPQGYLQAFQIDVSQPVDYGNPLGNKFSQRIYLSHLSENRPMVLSTRGYGVARNSLDELSILLNANQIIVTHRFFSNAQPDPLEWQYLDIRQAANDHHRIVEMFKPLYPGKWVNAGASKGGMTALFHRRFFPEDVTATVAYVAPIMFGVEDPRFRKFLLEQVGTPKAREKIKSFQRRLLEKRLALLPLVDNYARQNNYTFPFGAEASLEYAIVEYLFAFWQYGDGDVNRIPAVDATPETLFNHIQEVSSLYYYTQTDITFYEPFYYQAFTELGYCPYIYDHLKDLLQKVKSPTYRVFAPADVALHFDAGVMRDMSSWLQNNGSNIIYIYGANDPYTSAAQELTGKTNALRIIQSAANHRVKIADLSEKERVLQTLSGWLGITLTVSESTWQKAAAANGDPLAGSEKKSRRY